MFVPISEGRTYATIKKLYPQAVVIARTEGGWALFFSHAEYKAWKKIK